MPVMNPEHQAFEIPPYTQNKQEFLDEVAKFAMQGMLAHSTRYKPRDATAHWHYGLAEEAYEIAEAMWSVRRQILSVGKFGQYERLTSHEP